MLFEIDGLLYNLDEQNDKDTKKKITLTKDNFNTFTKEMVTSKGAVSDEKREGIFEHDYKCLKCRLEFKLYSFVEFRHNATNVYCPECGQKGQMLHSQKTIYTRITFVMFAGDEIFNLMDFQ